MRPAFRLRCWLPLWLTLALPLCGCKDRPGVPGNEPAGRIAAEAPAPQLPLRIAADLVVTEAAFGVLKTDADGEEQFFETSEVPAVDGQVFGWTIRLETTRETVHWQEHLRLPQPPADWGDAAEDPEILISSDGRNVAVKGESPVVENRIERFFWALAPGDPPGDYALDLAIEGREVARFRFHVPVPVQEEAMLVSRRAVTRAL
jgi:hypothetical protein